MKVLSKFALFTALVVFSACSVAETPFKVYEDKDKSFKQIEKFLAGKSTKWENKTTQSQQNSAGTAYTVDVYSRVYTYDDENFATASFSYDKDQEQANSFYQTYTHKKIAVTGYKVVWNDSGTEKDVDVSGYTIYELTAGPSGSASTASPRAASKMYALIKISGSKLSAFDSVDSVDIDNKKIVLRGSFDNATSKNIAPVPTEYKKL